MSNAIPLAEYGRRHAIVSLAGPLAEQRITKQGPRFRTAIHEAAHLVAGAVLVRVPFEASVVHEIDNRGKHIGGYVALHESASFRDDAGRLESSPADRRAAINALWVALPGIDFRGLRREMRVCQQCADELIDKHWPVIEGIAHEFLWSSHMQQEQIEALLAKFDLGSSREKGD